jgi:hypothetical protein
MFGYWRRGRTWPVILAAALSVFGAPPSAFAQLSGPCVNDANAMLSFAQPSVDWLDGVLLSYHVNIVSNCLNCTLSIVEYTPQLNDRPQTFVLGTNFIGSIGVLPMRTTRWALRLTGVNTNRDIACADITVNQPQGPLPDGQRDVTISNNTVADLRTFAHAVQTPGATIRIAGDAELNLSGLDELPLAPGVKILGDRRVHPKGPRLYTTTFPHALFVIPPASGSHERISGLRLDGGEPDDPFDNLGDEDADGIRVQKADVEIDHNEIYRWRGSGITVMDGDAERDLINKSNASAVSIHDNYIHHNQHPAGDVCCGHAGGYGVQTIHGAYAMDTHNVFTGNRHAIAGDGRPGTGYFFVGNLITDGGGVHSRFAYTHQIDMHGFGGDCSAFECGQGGEYEDVEFNTVWYSDGLALKLRGTPSQRMDVKHNAFFHGTLGTAMKETESGIVQSDNVFGVPDGGHGKQSCDFDGDGVPDDFRMTGVAWYYRSSLLDRRWVFLANSTVTDEKRVLLDKLTNDGRCDAATEGFVVTTGSGAPFDTAPPGDQVAVVGHPASLQLTKLSGGDTLFWAAAGLPIGLTLDERTGRISGTPTRADTHTVMFGADNRQGDTVTRVFHWTVNPDLRPVPNIVGATRSAAAGILASSGLSLGNERDVAQTDCARVGQVIDQTPAAGGAAPVGSTIAFSLGVKPSGSLRCN